MASVILENDSRSSIFELDLDQGRPTPCPLAKSGPLDLESGPLEKKKVKYISLLIS